jgi:hypothetical protein
MRLFYGKNDMMLLLSVHKIQYTKYFNLTVVTFYSFRVMHQVRGFLALAVLR